MKQEVPLWGREEQGEWREQSQQDNYKREGEGGLAVMGGFHEIIL